MEVNEENYHYSGGADGSDEEFGQCAAQVGHKVCHYTFWGHKLAPTIKPYCTMMCLPQALDLAKPWLNAAREKYLVNRKYPTSSDYTNHLLERNFHQIKEPVTSVYGISEFDKDGIVVGGTAWAVYMAIMRGIDVYVYDQKQEVWFKWSHESNSWFAIINPPRPEGHYAGIGRRKKYLKPAGSAAIRGLYGL